ncbi:uncharacterized protein LOC130703518 [Daphnia carinata]|uniref:uncharacterized protein LOC130703518 n=1 Tax=Daphnia carinata TaxID=120202 RepID=UPI002579BE15|nr:uncharacterized protein LOC130703518 [Daphnia carinata]XP_057380955.1 uncharacterized protein LOC130703518 [Daphnia carinata]
MSHIPFKDPLQSRTKKKLKPVKVFNGGKRGTILPVSESQSTGKTKSLSSGLSKRCSSLGKCSQVEAVHTTKFNQKIGSQIVRIEDETSDVDIVQRLHTFGIPIATIHPALCGHTVASPQNQQMNQPVFQTSAALMKNLEALKRFEIETRKLVNLKMEKDMKVQKFVNAKVATVLDQTRPVFSRLQPISLNVEQLMIRDESKLQTLAVKYAPQIRYKDPQICLEDFVDCVVISRTAVIPECSFHDLCYNYHIDPFTERQMVEDQLIPYTFGFGSV